MRKITYKPSVSFGSYIEIVLFEDKCLIYTSTGDSIVIVDAIKYDKHFYDIIYGYTHEMEKNNKTSHVLGKFNNELYDYINRYTEKDDNTFDLLSNLVYTESEYEEYRRYTFSKVYFKFLEEVKDFERVLGAIDNDYTVLYETLYKRYLHSMQGINDYNSKDNIEEFLTEVYNNFK